METFTSQKEAQQYVSGSARDIASNLKKCGGLACQRDSFLRTWHSANIISYASFEAREKKVGKKKQKKKGTHAVPKSVDADANKSSPISFAVTLSDSVFFPEGGGQFADHGTLTLKSGKGQENVVLYVYDAQNVDEICVLLCRLPAECDTNPEDVLNIMKRSDTEVEQSIDWDRRFDQMTQHSGQHLCSAVALSEFEIGTHTFSLGDNISYIDFTIDESWEKDHVVSVFAQIEQKVNEHIRDNVYMSPQWLEKDDPLFQTQARSRLLPDGINGPIRLVKIGNGIDFSTCCGTHVPTLGHLQMIKFFRMEKVKSNIFRVYFGAAKRLITIMDDMRNSQAKLTSMLACTETEQVERVAQLLDDKRLREKDIRELYDKLATCKVKEILEEFKDSEMNVAVVDLGNVDMGYMNLVSTKAVNENLDDNALFLFVGGNDGSDDGSFLLVGNKSIVDNFGKIVAEMFEGRGGGRNGKFQGKGSRIRSALDAVKDFLIYKCEYLKNEI